MSDEPRTIALPRGAELSGDDLNAIAASRPCRIIIVGGEPAAGKTTLLTAIYEQFRLGPFGGFMFAGSMTLPAFEERCHLGRAVSGRLTPDTLRTTARREPAFLHMSMVRQTSMAKYDLLLSDISGEDFSAARDSTEDAERLDILRLAARFCLLVDGAVLQDRRERHTLISRSRMLLRSLIEARVLTGSSAVELLLTKADTLTGASNEALSFVNDGLAGIRSEFEKHVGSLDVVSVAARPADGREPHKLDLLLERWCADLCLSPLHYTPALSDLSTPYDRFLITALE